MISSKDDLNKLDKKMIDYSIDKYIIKNNRTIQFDDFNDFDRVKQVFIASDFDVSQNCTNHFNGMKSLERFVVLDKHSRFYTEDGVLYANLTKNPKDKLRSKEMFHNFEDCFSGRVPVSSFLCLKETIYKGGDASPLLTISGDITG